MQTRAGLTDAQKHTMLPTLLDQALINPADASSINGGMKAGVFPPVINETTACSTLPMPIYAAPGGAYGGHRSYPCGLMAHGTFNTVTSLTFANGYRLVYGTTGHHVPVS